MVVIYDHLCHSIFNPPTKLNYVTLLVIFSPYILNGNADSRMVTQKPKKHTCCMQIVSCVRNVISTEEAEKKLNLMLLAHPSSCFLHTEYQYSKSYNVLNLILLAENIYSISCFLQWASLSGQTREGYAAEQNVRLCICYLGSCIFYLAKWIIW